MVIIGKVFSTVRAVLIAVLLIVVLSNTYIMIASVANPGTHPDVFGYSTAVVVSGSMRPAIEIDDLVVIKRCDSYEAGDIIAYNRDGSFITHRIAEVTPSGFVTKGDANNAEDEGIVPMYNVAGKVIRNIPGVGKVTEFLKSPLGMLIIVLLGYLAFFLPDKSKKDKENKNDNDNENDNENENKQ